MHLVRLLRATTIGVGLAVAFVACGNDSKTSSSSTPIAPEDLRASDAQVDVGLTKIDSIARSIVDALAADADKAADLAAGIEPAWEPVEGTVKANDPDTYIALEDSFALIGRAIADNDTAKARDAADAIAAAVETYLAEHPG
jgi:hypothetical protein